MAIQRSKIERLIYPRGDKRHFMNAPWTGMNGRIAMAIGFYGLTVFMLWVGGVNTVGILSLSVPLAIGVYFAIRGPISLINFIAFAAVIGTVFVVESSFNIASADEPTRLHTEIDHASDGSNLWYALGTGMVAGGVCWPLPVVGTIICGGAGAVGAAVTMDQMRAAHIREHWIAE